MKRFLLALLAALLVAAVQGGILGRIFHRDSTSTTTTTTTTTTTEEPRRPFFINNNVPAIEEGCVAQFKCKKKLTQVPVPRPCVKYCLHRITCPNNQTTTAKPNQCVDLDEQQVLEAYHSSTEPPSPAGQAVTEKVMMVAMIDFPCQPGYLPDHRGRCREIW
ncbi:uncharacterized protein LOC108115574 [Drosophila eugracilis]|uniref:uncharacterized protein LOC108115574 n=1 Tax=Drosophila eugracilis TaxID=29029 RepID=UPI0007E73024|nr:uncharacterized protein LOC108115574 [Drosophila eugracilis]